MADPFGFVAPEIDPLTGNPVNADFGALSRFGGMLGSAVRGLVPSQYGDALAGRTQAAPEIPGQITEGDVFRSDMQARKNALGGAEQAVQLMGMGAPLAMTGAAGIFGGKLAKTADLAKLKQAEEMHASGAYPDDIHAQTGWFQGADKRWRFEIPDDATKFSQESLKPQEYNILGNSITALTGKAGDALPHPELYAAYPHLGDLDVVQGRGNFHGTYHAPSERMPGSIALNFDSLGTPEAARSTMLHEFQHAVQEHENFARGGSAEYLKDIPNPDVAKYRSAQADPQLMRYKQLSASPEYAAELEAQNALWKEKYQPQYDALMARVEERGDLTALQPQIDKVFSDANAEFGSLHPVMTETDALYQALRKRGLPTREPSATLNPDDAYRRMAGEVEARNVQHRADWDAQKRSDIPPAFSQDMPDADQIVRFGSLGPAMQSTPPAGIRAYHGSPYDFDRFDLSKIGTGEGAQAYGHGLYFAEAEPVARQYRDTLASRDMRIEGKPFTPENYSLTQLAAGTKGDPEALRMALQSYIEKGRGNPYASIGDAQKMLDAVNAGTFHLGPNPGRMYEVNIGAKPEQFLDWDKPLSAHPENVRDLFKKSGVHSDYAGPMGTRIEGNSTIGNLVKRQLQDPNSLLFNNTRDAGIPGIRYLDQGSRAVKPDFWTESRREGHWVFSPTERFGPFPTAKEADAVRRQKLREFVAPQQTSNYVVFDPGIIDILRKYALPGMAGGGATAFGSLAPDNR